MSSVQIHYWQFSGSRLDGPKVTNVRYATQRYAYQRNQLSLGFVKLWNTCTVSQWIQQLHGRLLNTVSQQHTRSIRYAQARQCDEVSNHCISQSALSEDDCKQQYYHTLLSFKIWWPVTKTIWGFSWPSRPTEGLHIFMRWWWRWIRIQWRRRQVGRPSKLLIARWRFTMTSGWEILNTVRRRLIRGNVGYYLLRIFWAHRESSWTWSWHGSFLPIPQNALQNTSDYSPQVQQGHRRDRPCCERDDTKAQSLDAITMKGARSQSWLCGETARNVPENFHLLKGKGSDSMKGFC